MHQILFYSEFIIHLYMFRVQLCSSSGQNCISPMHRTAACRVWWCQMLCDTILTCWWWAQLCSKHVDVYNKLIVKQDLMHQVGQLLRLYWDARSAKHQNTYLSQNVTANLLKTFDRMITQHLVQAYFSTRCQSICPHRYVSVKKNQSRHRHGVVQRVPGS